MQQRRQRDSEQRGYNGHLILENQKGVPSGSIGGLNFTTQFTGGPTPNSSLPSGQGAFDAWASFLLGYPGSGSITRSVTVAFNQWVTGLYLQDDWHLTPKITVNMGVRWDVETGFGERLPTGLGLLAFRNLAEAIAGVAEIDGNYARHSRAARELAEASFDSRKCLRALLSACEP